MMQAELIISKLYRQTDEKAIRRARQDSGMALVNKMVRNQL
jgi:hypothetical protein